VRTENSLGTELFENDDIYVTIIMWFPWRVFLKHKSKMTGDCCVFKLGSDFRSIISFLDNSVLLYLEAPLLYLCYWPHPATDLQLHSHSCSVAVQISSYPCSSKIIQICIVVVKSARNNIRKDGTNWRKKHLFVYSEQLCLTNFIRFSTDCSLTFMSAEIQKNTNTGNIKDIKLCSVS